MEKLEEHKNMELDNQLNKQIIGEDIKNLGENYKTADVDRLIRRYVKEKCDVSFLREDILKEQQYHRIYFYVSLKQIKDVNDRMEFINHNLLFSDWWHTDQLIKYVDTLPFETALTYAEKYVMDDDLFIRRWGYVMFISKLCRDKEHLKDILALLHDDNEHYVIMAEAWLMAELAIFFPDEMLAWFQNENTLKYNINSKAIQKISDSYRISNEYKKQFKELREYLKNRAGND